MSDSLLSVYVEQTVALKHELELKQVEIDKLKDKLSELERRIPEPRVSFQGGLGVSAPESVW